MMNRSDRLEMKLRTRYLTGAALVIAAAVLVPLWAAAPEQEVLAAEKDWANAVMARDFDALNQILSAKLIYAHSTGEIESKSDYLGKLRNGERRYDLIQHSKTTVRVFGAAAAAHSIVRMKGASAGVPFDNKLMMMHLWVKQDGRWRLAAHQTTRLD